MKSKELVKDLTDEEVGLRYLEVKDTSEDCKVQLDGLKVDIFIRCDTRGEAKGEHKIIKAGSIEMVKEVRKLIDVTEEAVKLLESKKLDSCIDVTATINIKEGVDQAKIPPKLLKDMEKYFDIELHKSVTKDMLKSLLASSKITEDEFKSVVTAKESYALKVKKV